MFGFFTWWYGQGLIVSWKTVYWLIDYLSDFFSLEVLVKTWFSPWKNDVLSAKNIALSDRVKLWEMNLVSRLIGFVLRSLILVIGLTIIAFICLLSTGLFFIWIIAPILIFIFPAIGLIMLKS